MYNSNSPHRKYRDCNREYRDSKDYRNHYRDYYRDYYIGVSSLRLY